MAKRAASPSASAAATPGRRRRRGRTVHAPPSQRTASPGSRIGRTRNAAATSSVNQVARRPARPPTSSAPAPSARVVAGVDEKPRTACSHGPGRTRTRSAPAPRARVVAGVDEKPRTAWSHGPGRTRTRSDPATATAGAATRRPRAVSGHSAATERKAEAICSARNGVPATGSRRCPIASQPGNPGGWGKCAARLNLKIPRANSVSSHSHGPLASRANRDQTRNAATATVTSASSQRLSNPKRRRPLLHEPGST